MARGIACHVISPEVSFSFLLQSFFIDKEENHLFKNIVSFELYCSLYCCIFGCSRKKEKFTEI